jgi:hypothetical protein
MSRVDDQGKLMFQASPELHLYAAYADFPVPLFFRELDTLFPASKFILTYRDVEQWADSVEYIFSAWWDSWIKSADWPLIGACHKTFYGTDRFDRYRAIQAYERHNANVRTYFKSRPEALLELDMTGDVGWTAVCGFLETAIPPVPFPHLNRSVPGS